MAKPDEAGEPIVKQHLAAQLVGRVVDPEREIDRVGLELSEHRIGEREYLKSDVRGELGPRTW
jgi:hypothetical protein